MARMSQNITAAAIGAGAAWVRHRDATNGKVKLSTQMGTYVELGLAGIGLIGSMVRLPLGSDMLESLSLAGFTLTGERLTRSAMAVGGFGTGVPMNMITGRSYAGMPGMGMNMPPRMTQFNSGGIGFAQKEASLTVY